MTFYVFDSGLVVNGSYVASVLNRLSTGQMTTFTTPYAVFRMIVKLAYGDFEPCLHETRNVSRPLVKQFSLGAI